MEERRGRERERERWVAIGGHVCHSHFLLLFLLFSSDQELLLLPHLSILLGVSVNSFLFLWHRTMHWRARSNDFAMLGMQRHYACASRTLLGTDEQPDPRYVPRRWPRDDRPHQLAVFLRIELPSRCLYACVQLRTYIGIRTAYFFLRTVDSWSARRIDTCPPTTDAPILPIPSPFRSHFEKRRSSKIDLYVSFSSPIRIPILDGDRRRRRRNFRVEENGRNEATGWR